MNRPPGYRQIALLMLGLAVSGAPSRAVQPGTFGTCDPATAVLTRWKAISPRDGLPPGGVRAVRVVGGQVWVGSDEGMAVRTEGRWKRWTREDGLPAHTVSAIDVHPHTRDAWLGTWGNGLIRFSAGRFDRFDQINSGLAGNIVFDVAVVGNRVWAATNGGLSAFDPGNDEWTLFFPRRGIGPENVVTDLLVHGTDLLAGVWRGGVYRFESEGSRWTSMWRPGGREVPESFAFAVGGRSLWLASRESLWHGDGGEAWSVVHGPLCGGDDRFVYSLASRGDQRVWLGTEGGLASLASRDDLTWVSYHRGDGDVAGYVVAEQDGVPLGARRLRSGPPDGRVRCISFDAEGVWVGTDRGLSYGYDPQAWDALPVMDGGHADGSEGARVVSDADTVSTSIVKQSTERCAPSIALFGPRSRTITLPGQQLARGLPHDRTDMLAAQIALEQANARGGYRSGRPFGLFTRPVGYARYGWGLPEDDFVIFSDDPGVAGVVGWLGPRDRAAEAVACGTEIPVVSVAPVVETNAPVAATPWIFGCLRDQKRRHRAVLDYLIDELGHERVAALYVDRASDTDRLEWWKQHARARGRPLVGEVHLPGTAERLEKALETLELLRPGAVLTWSDASTTAQIVRSMRARGMHQLVVASPMVLSARFVEGVGKDAGPVIALAPRAPEDHPSVAELTRKRRVGGELAPRLPVGATALDEFATEYAKRNLVGKVHKPPDPQAYLTLDAMDHLMSAIRRSGADRNAVRVTLEAMRHSVDGEQHYEGLYPPGDVGIMRLTDGNWVAQTVRINMAD